MTSFDRLQLAYLGAVLVASRQEVLDSVPNPEWFTGVVAGVPLGEVVILALEVVKAGHPVTPVMLISEARKRNLPWAEALANRVIGEAMTAHDQMGGLLAEYVQLIKQQYIADRASRIGQELIAAAGRGLDFRPHVKRLVDLVNEEEVQGAVPIHQAAERFLAEWSKSKRLKVRTGIGLLDQIVFISEGDLVILGARTSHGKTSLALQVAAANAGRGVPVVYYSSEMTREHIAARLASQLTGIPLHRIVRGQVKPGSEEAKRIIEALKPLPIQVIQTNRVHEVLIDLAHRFATGESRLAVVDFVQDFSMPGNVGDYERISYFVRELKALAQSYDGVVLGTAQINREATKGEKRPPKRSELKGSGTFEETADTVLLLWRQPLDEGGLDNHGEVIVAKQRNGSLGRAPVIFHPEVAKFVSM